jgi:hypothetical protein
MTRKVREIILSHFTMVPHADGGWAVPGGGRIEEHHAAINFAHQWNHLMRELRMARESREERELAQ